MFKKKSWFPVKKKCIWLFVLWLSNTNNVSDSSCGIIKGNHPRSCIPDLQKINLTFVEYLLCARHCAVFRSILLFQLHNSHMQ